VYKYFEDFIDNEFNDVYIVKKDLDISKLKAVIISDFIFFALQI
jgi:hypothetical protein